MRTMELKCIHQNTLNTCAGKDHCQEMQKQNRKRSVCLVLGFSLVAVFFCLFVCFAVLAFADTHRESASFHSGLFKSDAPLFCILLMWG